MSRRAFFSGLGGILGRPRGWLLGGGGLRAFLAGVLLLAILGGAVAGIYFAVARGGGGAPTVEGPPPTPTTGPDWEKLQLPELEERYVLTAAQFDASGIAADTSFALESRQDADLEDLEERLLVDPPVALRFEDVSSKRATVSPREPLAEDRSIASCSWRSPKAPPPASGRSRCSDPCGWSRRSPATRPSMCPWTPASSLPSATKASAAWRARSVLSHRWRAASRLTSGPWSSSPAGP